MVKLIDLHPAWIDYGDRKGLGIAFDCMIGVHENPSTGLRQPCTIRNWILFVNPLDGGAPWPYHSRSLILAQRVAQEAVDAAAGSKTVEISGCGTSRWTRTGDTFETLSMTPSVNAHSCGHLTLTNGEFR